MSIERPVRVLDAAVARKIAAGEVIDRPAAVVRELLDNALDAGARSIDISIEDGGLRLMEVSDDGFGMTREDLLLCTLPHATSKIRREEDLLALESLGFRGEALGSIAAVAALEILTSTDGNGALRLRVGPALSPQATGSPLPPTTDNPQHPVLSGTDEGPETRGRYGLTPHITSDYRSRGTSVRVRGLFENLPARKKFMKRASSEAGHIYRTIVEKALAFPECAFRYRQDGAVKLVLPAAESLVQRFVDAVIEENGTARGRGGFVHQASGGDEGFRVDVIIGGPELSRTDRRFQYIYANRRRIQDYSFQQALEYGAQGWFPNNSHPIAAVFLHVDGPLIDFNIHPAKREARFRDSARIHRSISSLVRAHFEALARRQRFGGGETAGEETKTDSEARAMDLFDRAGYGQYHLERESGGTAGLAQQALSRTPGLPPAPYPGAGAPEARARLEKLLEDPPRLRQLHEERAEAHREEIRYLGQALGLYLVVEGRDEILFIDQHAAHERILFDALMEKPPAAQELLVPYPFTTEDRSQSAFLAGQRDELLQLGIRIEKEGPDSWVLAGLPAAWESPDGQTVEAILDLAGAGEDRARRWYATIACKKAIKDGQILDETRGRELALAALALSDPRCPHGRPILVRMSRQMLAKAVQRS